jgi:hypothetical protein
MALTEKEKKLVDEHIEVCRRMIAVHRQKIIELTRQKNAVDHQMESMGFNIIKRNHEKD